MRVVRRWKIGSLSWAGGGQRVASGRCSAHQLYHVAGQYNSSGMRHSAVEQEEKEKEEEEEGEEEEEAGLHATASAPTPPYPVSRHPQEYSVNSNFAFNGREGGRCQCGGKSERKYQRKSN